MMKKYTIVYKEYEFLAEQIRKIYGNSGVIFCPYISTKLKDPKKEKNQ